VSVLESFIANPTQTRHEVRVKLGVLNELAAEVFALIVFMCDELLQLKPAIDDDTPTTEAATRFFAIAKKLPMELQMVLCRRAVGSMMQNILHQDSEAACLQITCQNSSPSFSITIGSFHLSSCFEVALFVGVPFNFLFFLSVFSDLI